MKRLLLFDFDGVVADSLEVFSTSFMALCRAEGFDRIATREDFLALFDDNYLQSMLKLGFGVLKLRRLAKQFSPRITEAMAVVRPFDGMIDVLNALADAHPLYVITSSMTPAVEGFLDRHGVKGVRAVLGADHEPSKVKKIRAASAEHPGLPVYYVGDTRGDMREGREAGAETVAVTWGWHDEARLRAANPDHVVHTPEELRALLLGATPAP